MTNHDFWLIVMAVATTRVYDWIKAKLKASKERKERPYKWACVDCRERNDGSAFSCSANDVTALDRMILAHKATHVND